MSLIGIVTGAGTIASALQPIIEWGIERDKIHTQIKTDIAKAYQGYIAELKLNWAILEKIKLDEINTRDIGDPAIKGIASRLKTKAAETLLLSLLTLLQNPEKAVKALPAGKPGKTDGTEAKLIIKAVISVTEKTRELQCFTSLSEAERKILKGFYARARLKHIKEKSLFIKQSLQV
jgi:hypothetical protein